MKDYENSSKLKSAGFTKKTFKMKQQPNSIFLEPALFIVGQTTSYVWAKYSCVTCSFLKAIWIYSIKLAKVKTNWYFD